MLSNGEIELQIPLGIRPRITSFRFMIGENIFYEAPDIRKHFGSDQWFSYGGHRLWHAPEQNPGSYYPDNLPVKIIEPNNIEKCISNFLLIKKIVLITFNIVS